MPIPTKCKFRHVDKGNLRAFVTLEYGDFIIRDFKVLEKKDGGLWVAAPSRKIEDDRYIDMAYLPDPDRREAFQRFVLQQYAEDVRKHKESATS